MPDWRPPGAKGRRGSKTPDERRQGSGGEKAIGKRDAATRGGTQLRGVDPYVISMGAGLFADVRASVEGGPFSENAPGQQSLQRGKGHVCRAWGRENLIGVTPV